MGVSPLFIEARRDVQSSSSAQHAGHLTGHALQTAPTAAIKSGRQATQQKYKAANTLSLECPPPPETPLKYFPQKPAVPPMTTRKALIPVIEWIRLPLRTRNRIRQFRLISILPWLCAVRARRLDLRQLWAVIVVQRAWVVSIPRLGWYDPAVCLGDEVLRGRAVGCVERIVHIALRAAGSAAVSAGMVGVVRCAGASVAAETAPVAVGVASAVDAAVAHAASDAAAVASTIGAAATVCVAVAFVLVVAGRTASHYDFLAGSVRDFDPLWFFGGFLSDVCEELDDEVEVLLRCTPFAVVRCGLLNWMRSKV